MSDSALKRWGNSTKVARVCEWCEGEFEMLPSETRSRPGRFCSRTCTRAWLHYGPGGGERLTRLQAGRVDWRGAVADLKQAERLVDIYELSAQMPADLRKTFAAILGHVHSGGLSPAPNEFGLLLFSEPAIARYIQWLRAHPDGRLRRFGDPKFRGDWIKGRHGLAAARRAYGQANAPLARARGTEVGRPAIDVTDAQLQRVRDMAARGKSQRAIVAAVGLSRGKVRRILAAADPS